MLPKNKCGHGEYKLLYVILTTYSRVVIDLVGGMDIFRITPTVSIPTYQYNGQHYIVGNMLSRFSS